MASFKTQLTLPYPVETVFEFFMDFGNHEKMSPPEVGLKFVDPPSTIANGTQIEFKVQSFGFVQQIVHEIIEFDRPHVYAEKQLKGPLGSWTHWHRFESLPDGQMMVTDQIEFDPPGGMIGLMVTEARILEQLEDGFDHRHQRIRELLKVTA